MMEMRWGKERRMDDMCSLPLRQVSSFPWPWPVFLGSPLFWQCLFGSSRGRRGELVWSQTLHSECVPYVPVMVDLSGKTTLQKKEPLLCNPHYLRKCCYPNTHVLAPCTKHWLFKGYCAQVWRWPYLIRPCDLRQVCIHLCTNSCTSGFSSMNQ